MGGLVGLRGQVVAAAEVVITEELRSYDAAMCELGNREKLEISRWLSCGVKPQPY